MEKAFLISSSPSNVNSAACGKEMGGLPVKGPRMTILDFIEMFACIALYFFLGKILLVGHSSSLSNVNEVFLAFPVQQLLWWLDISIEFLIYRQETDWASILLVTTTQLFSCFLFQPLLMISLRKRHVNDRYFQNTCLFSRWESDLWKEVMFPNGWGTSACGSTHILQEGIC